MSASVGSQRLVIAALPPVKRATPLHRNGDTGRANGRANGVAKSVAKKGRAAATSTAKNGAALHAAKVNSSEGVALNGAPINGRLRLSANVQRSGKLPSAVASANGAGAKSLVVQDRRLVDRCLGGETTAWSQLYDRFHGSLLASIRAFLGRAGHDMHLVDEISARVWYSLVRNDFELLDKFDPDRGCRLSTFLSVLGKSEARLLLRSERRRKTRECVASRPEMEHADTTGGSLTDDEFLATLSPRERAFYLDILVAADRGNGEAEYSQQNQWQLRHRVRKKLEQFLE